IDGGGIGDECACITPSELAELGYPTPPERIPLRKTSPGEHLHMRVDLYGLAFETPRATVYLWSPWRASALEHRLFEAVLQVPGLRAEQEADEMRVDITDAKTWRGALQGVCRVLKGWQEEASDTGNERRAWRWLIEGDTDDHGYDHQN